MKVAVKPLGELCKLTMGRTPPRGNSKYWDASRITENIWISIADMTKSSDGILTDSKEYLSDEGSKTFPKVKKGTLLLSFKLSIGKLAIAGTDLQTNEAIVAINDLNEDLILRDYLYYYLFGFDWSEALTGRFKVKGNTLNKKILEALPIKFPSLDKQHEIVEKLDEAFAEIKLAQLETVRLLDQSAKLLGARFDETFTCITERHGMVESGSIIDVRDGTHDSPKYLDSGFPLITSKNLRDGLIDFSNVSLIGASDFEVINRRSKVDAGDLLFAMIGTIGNPVVVKVQPNFAIKNVALFKGNSAYDMTFLSYFLRSPKIKEKFEKEAKGTTQRFLGLGYLRTLKIPNLPIKGQIKVASELSQFEGETKRLELNLNRRLVLLQKLSNSILSSSFLPRNNREVA